MNTTIQFTIISTAFISYPMLVAAYIKGGGSQAKFVGKIDLEIGVYQKTPPIGGTFGRVSESPRPSGSELRARP